MYVHTQNILQLNITKPVLYNNFKRFTFGNLWGYNMQRMKTVNNKQQHKQEETTAAVTTTACSL